MAGRRVGVSVSGASLLALGAVLAFFRPVAAQDETRHGIFIESLDVNVVNIEVVVSDKQGNPVLGLTADDFEILEDGEPVDVSNFFAVENARRVSAHDGPLPPDDTAGAETSAAGPSVTGEELTAKDTSLLVEIAKSFEILADPDGIRLQPRWRDAGFDVLEVARGRITLDGAPVEVEGLRVLTGAIADLVGDLAELDQDRVAQFFNVPESGAGDDALPDNQRLFLVVFVDSQNIAINHRNRVIEELDVDLRKTVRPGDRVMVASFNRRVEIEQP